MESQSPFKNLPPAERLNMLRDNAYAIKEGEMYQKPLSEEEKHEYQKKLLETTLSIQKDSEKLKEIRKEYKERIKKNETLRNESAQAVQFGSVLKNGTVYLMDDQEGGMMEMYAEDGTPLGKRPLLPDERQLSFMSVKRTGTHDEK
jgi:hypothetical protein